MTGDVRLVAGDELERLLYSVVLRAVAASHVPRPEPARSAPERPEAPEALLKLEAVARLVTLNERTIRRAIKAGTFPAPLRFGESALRFRREDVEAWIEGRERAK